jgi:transglutaminase-like putative cysteine protease/tetratricopeptide (TPR) repeat protein
MRTAVSAITLSVLLRAALASAGEPWAEPPFAAAAADWVRRTPAPAGEHVTILLEESEQSFEADGRRTNRYRLVYRLETAEAVDGWSSLEAEWSPWHQERPELRARVVQPDGSETWLDPRTIAESGIGQADEQILSDRRQLTAPLPALGPGAVVEMQSLVRDTAPAFVASTSGRFHFGGSVPVHRARLVLDSPGSLPVRWITRRLDGFQPRRDEKDGRVRLVFEREGLSPVPDPEPGLPPDAPRWPSVSFSTGRSWADIARAYSDIVDRQLEGASLEQVVAAASGPRGRTATIARLLERVHRTARYTGVEFGEASYVPRTPREVIERQYGDCKDKATLLVGLLRAAGIPAELALLSAGAGEDVLEDLPAFGVFDHAIVHVPGKPELWIDATAERVPVGELPLGAQGRWALVASAQTTGLARTPDAEAAANGAVESREFVLAEIGPSRVSETTEYRGSFGQSARERYDGGADENHRRDLARYVADEYLAEALGSFEHGPVADLSQPLRLSVVASKARRGVTDDDQAVVAYALSRLTESLPALLKSDDTAAATATRESDWHFASPHVMEQRYRIVPPPGFVLREMPPDEDLPIGRGRLSARWTARPEGVLEGVLRMDTGPRRITAAEFTEMRRAVKEVRAREWSLVRFAHVGKAHLTGGRHREALAEFRRLTALHPRESLHHTQLAMALLQIGLGEAAREAARRAVEVEPTSALAHRRLGWVLQHDALGRRLGVGSDYAGAEAAYRRSVELDPTDAHTRMNLAYLLEHDAAGERYGRGAKLEEAADLYWRLAREDGQHIVNLPIVLLRSGRLGELREAAAGFADRESRDAWEVTAVAVEKGPAAALERAARVDQTSARRQALIDTADRLIRLRRYADAAALLREAAAGATNAAALRNRVESLSRLGHYEDAQMDASLPAGVALLWLRSVALGESDEKVGALLAGSPAPEALAALRTDWTEQRRLLDLPVEAFADFTLTGLQASVEGDPRGWRVRLQGPASPMRIFYLVQRPEGPRILCASFALCWLGEEALRRLDDGDAEAARRVLDWAREQVNGDADDPLGGHPLARFWTQGDPADPVRMRLAAAAALATRKATAESALAVLGPARLAATSDGERSRLDHAMVFANLALERPAEVLRILEGRPVAGPPRAFGLRVGALSTLKRWADMRRLAEERLAALPGDTDALRAVVTAQSGLGDFKAVDETCAQLLETSRVLSGDYNNCAWNALVSGSDRQLALDRARRAVERSERRAASQLHTLAALYAESGQPAEAREIILEAMSASTTAEPKSEDYYVLGLIAEAYGETGAARAAYAHVTEEDELGNSTWALTQRRLATLPSAGDKKTRRR